jgi:hypothetical protein
MRGNDWKDKTRSEKLASVLYPSLTSEETRRQMRELSALELKKSPTATPLLSNQKRGAVSPLGGQAKKARR